MIKRTFFVLALSFFMAFGGASPTYPDRLDAASVHQTKGAEVCVQLVGQKDWVCTSSL